MRKTFIKSWIIAILCAVITACPLLQPTPAAAAGTMFTSVSSELNTTFALDADGRIWAWGSNISGQFGNGTTSGSNTPLLLKVLDNETPVTFKEIKNGFNHAIALDTSGRLWAAGDNVSGQLGLGAGTPPALSWTKLNVTDGSPPVVFQKIACTRSSTFALDSNGKLWIWGQRTFTADPAVPIRQTINDGGGTPVVFQTLEANDEFAFAIDDQQHLWTLFQPAYSPSQFTVMDGGTEAKFQAISAGSAYGTGPFLGLAIDTNGNIWSWGGNDQGQLGDGGISGSLWAPAKVAITDNGNPVTFVHVSGGLKHVLALDDTGNMWTWGLNSSGQFGDGTTVNAAPHKVPVADNGNPVQFASVWGGYGASYGLDASGRLWSWGTQDLLGDNTSGGGQQKTPKKIFIKPRPALTASVTHATYLEPVTLTAAVYGDFSFPAGNVTFKDGVQVLSSVPLNAGGNAQWSFIPQPGGHTFTALYEGDSLYLAGTTNAQNVTVDMPAAPFITVTPSTTAPIIGPVTFTVTAQTYGSSNALAGLKWLPGDNAAAAFASAGTDILSAGTFTVTANGSYTVYAKDLAGNEAVKKIPVTNIVTPPDNSTISPSAAVFDKYAGAAANTDVPTTLSLNGNTFTGIANNAVPLVLGTDYTVSGDTVTILKAYLNAQPIGTTILTFTFSGGADQMLSIAVSNWFPSSGSSSSSNDASTSETASPKYEIAVDPAGGVVITADSSSLVTETEPDGTVTQKLIVPADVLHQVQELLKDAGKPSILIKAGNVDPDIQVQLPGEALAELAGAYPQAAVGVELDGSSLELQASVLDLNGLARRLGVALADLNIVTSMKPVSSAIGTKLDQLGLVLGFRVLDHAVDFRVQASANGQTIELRDFGSKYMTRGIVYTPFQADGNVIAVYYDPYASTVSYIPTHLGARSDGKKEAVMQATHYSIYAAVEADKRTFSDMASHWAKEDVEQLASKLIVNGAAPERFAPDESITRAEFAALLVRSLGLSTEDDPSYQGFADVPAAAWYAPLVNAAVKAGLVNGVTDDRFEPGSRISREQMAVMLARALNLTPDGKNIGEHIETLAEFKDRDAISAWSQAAVSKTVQAGIINGMDGGIFAPADNATRAQAATMLKRFLQAVHFIE
ncbi:S-layer homology domain-containing protein [Paenibacillus thalictri]|uniref:SLH domain-containing protein n=1 Tax=Paenibacillus thalictri TaxID=2527873 RepID=A0A4Q9DJ14_9BACL|nr:S-layer homology domain-containing protein [Paenibacillus thalictri]TBL73339.1 hypothetical protein EYB31_27055 [Paenibacillus thalictri]